MNTFYRLVLVIVILSNFTSGRTQTIDSTFGAPLTIPMVLAGNFGEIRSGHFHAGIDIKTQQKEGFPVVASMDGYISRIKISLGGYGNCLYITHTNGYTTVYGHLQSFNDEITSYVRKEQYDKEKFTIELFLNSKQIRVSKGDTVAISGNSGGSGGPHLHFEIRKTKGGIPQNPLKFGFDIKDDIPPILKNVALYPLNDTSLVNGKNETVIIPLRKSNGHYHVQNENLKARGVIGVGIEAIDKLNGASNRCGAYEIKLAADSNVIYTHRMDQIGFYETRFINSHVDFYQWKKNKIRIQKSYHTSYNKLGIYPVMENNGKLFFSKYGHDLKYTVKDVYGNTSTVSFQVQVDTTSASFVAEKDTLPVIPYDEYFSQHMENATISFPKYSLYEDLHFSYKMTDTIPLAVTPVHHFQDLYTGLHEYVTIRIKTPDVTPEIGSKYIAVSLTDKYKMIAPEGGKYQDGWIEFKTRSLGPYTVMLDTVPPVIKPLFKLTESGGISHTTDWKFKTADNISGVKRYDAYIDEKWTLLEYDYKTGLIWLHANELNLEKGKHSLKIVVKDAVNNIKSYSLDFIW